MPTPEQEPTTGAPATDWPALIDDVRALLLDMAQTDLTELDLTLGAVRIRIQQQPGPVARAVVTPADGEADATETLHTIASPLNGVYYDRPSPTAPPFVQVGERIEIGQTVCLVEAMKSFNEIHADAAGTIRQIVPDSGQLVSRGAPLLLIDPATT